MRKIWQDELNNAVPATTLSLFRSLFGLITAGYLIGAWLNGQLFWMYVAPKFFFPLPFSPIPLPPPPPEILWLPFLTLVFAGFLIGFGRWVGPALLTYVLLKAYLSFVDISWFNNHDYLFMLIPLLFFLLKVPAGEKLGGLTSAPIAIWQLWSFRLLFLVVYLYGGVGKIQWDWLDGSIVRQFSAGWIEDGVFARGSLAARLIVSEFSIYFISYSGLVVDLIVAPLLLWSRTRTFCIAVLCAFHLMNSYLFTIGPFPWVSMAGLLVFADPKKFDEAFRYTLRSSGFTRLVGRDASSKVQLAGSGRFWVVAIFLLIQILLPLRRFGYAGPTTWTSNAHLFSWLMMGHSKQLKSLIIWVEDSQTGERREHHPLELLVERQASHFGVYATHSVQFAKHLSQVYEKQGVVKPRVFMEIVVSYNGRPAQYFVSPKLDLASVNVGFLAQNSWVLPLEPPLHP